jgi:3-methyl-2-oxobutanoate hydroxymethyltransferase
MEMTVDKSKVTTETLRRMKREGRRIAMLTAYDYTSALLFDRSGIDVLLVGDSLGMVVLGYETTIPVTVDEVIHHTKAVSRGASRAMIVADLPFMSYETSERDAMENGGALLKVAGATAVKLEGGEEYEGLVRRMTTAGIPVMGHLGLTPQSIHQFGGYGVRAAEASEARKLMADALALQGAGAFAIVLEKVPAPLASLITEYLDIPTIGIGAGPGCDGQVLVSHDMLDLFTDFTPKFVKKFADLAGTIATAVGEYAGEVREGAFPGPEHSYQMDENIIGTLREEFGR